ncbi:amino acid deaminase/aldolase [Nocardioides sp. MAH-18]|uniref:Amino acid deaminase/aldolase n=1 Tax=Nocardioides agri TaxID=2682843 RepID=A0A6L6XKW5_9ACTN|nr:MULTISPECIES: amino acid deaminase/aldolase [unclassified Nocardioides]MBA2952989.1 amino acid deaminase/aldolase [Nocardioides sp. CGMCC 1.13656]MVQ47859.1 amino acid deaminase/aldolase [Nocardioides sp. MAH-18]
MASRSGAGVVARNQLWTRLNDAVAKSDAPLPTPVFVVDLDAFDANAADLVRRAGGLPIRVASKSLRIPALIERALAHPGFQGVLAFTLREALWLYREGISDDLVVAYPTVDRGALAELVADEGAAAAITLMVDSAAHLDVVESVRIPSSPQVRLALDVDAGLHLAGQHIGPKRSPLQDTAAIVALAREIARREGLRLVGVMTYEGQVAGLQDTVPTARAKSVVVRRLKALSMSQLAVRRREIDAALRQVASLEFWNGGGSGSVAETAADAAVTEIAAGSGLLVPTLFDHYASFEPRPASYVGLPVVRRPAPGVVTVHGGGIIASGPTGADRSPTPWAPAGLELTALEGAGEVQTPLTGPSADLLEVGDLVWFRPAKSGEPFEHAPTVHLLSGSEFVDSVPSYRGCGQAF